jgi:hypothetical protein
LAFWPFPERLRPGRTLAVCGKTGKFEVLPFRCGVFCG